MGQILLIRTLSRGSLQCRPLMYKLLYFLKGGRKRAFPLNGTFPALQSDSQRPLLLVMVGKISGLQKDAPARIRGGLE